MRSLKNVLFFIFFCYFFNTATAQYIVVDNTLNAQQLVENVLVKSACVTITNSKASGDDFSGSNTSYSYFNAGSSNFPFQEGVVLSTWSSTNSVGPFIRNSGGGSENWKGDTDLEQALNLSNTFNSTVLEFDFLPLTNFVSFNYIFASNEYQDYFPCQFSDGFAFLIKEKGTADPYINIAVLPNTTTPVSSANVHPQIPSFNGSNGVIRGCSAKNENYFNGYNTDSSPINYSAQTKVLNAQSPVIAGKTYHIKLVIADHLNVDYDSAVFIEAGSFSPKIDLGLEQTVCFGEKSVIDTGLNNSAYTYKWFKNGTELPETNASITVESPGEYTVKVVIAGSCEAEGNVIIKYTSPITSQLVQCGDDSGNALFDLTQLNTTVNGGNTDSVNYYETLADLINKNPIIINPSNYSAASKTIYAKVSNTSSGCEKSAEIQLQVLRTSSPVQTINLCDGNVTQNSFRLFDFRKEISPQILPKVMSPNAIQGYYLNENDAILKTNILPNNYATTTDPQNIFVRIENGLDCYGIYEIELKIVPYTTSVPSIITGTEISDFSGDTNSVLIQTNKTGPIEYSLDGTQFQKEPIFRNVKTGIYTAYVRETYSCSLSTMLIYVLDYPRFFTPNGDGINDSWRIKNLNLFPNATISIFDRYGKLLKQMSSNNLGWDGTFNNVQLPSDDYWFNIDFKNGKIIKGNFSLKR